MSLAQLADLAQILAEAFLEPDADLQEGLEALLEMNPSPLLAEPLARMTAQGLPAEDQPVEYARLFLQPKDTEVIHLFESVQAQGHHMAPEVLASLKAIHDEADIAIQEELGIPPDHLGLELACLSFLLGEVIEGEPGDRERLVELAQRLLQEHLHPLLTAVAQRLPRAAAHPYYQAAVDLAAALCSESGKALAEI